MLPKDDAKNKYSNIVHKYLITHYKGPIQKGIASPAKTVKLEDAKYYPLRYRQRQPEDRVTIASLLQLNHSLREIDTVLRRSPSTVCREQCHNSIMDAAAVVHSPDLNDALAVTFAHPVAKLSELDLIKRNSTEYGERK